MPSLFVGPNGILDSSLTPPGRLDRLEAEAQGLADECQVQIDVYHSVVGDDLDRAEHVGVTCTPSAV